MALVAFTNIKDWQYDTASAVKSLAHVHVACTAANATGSLQFTSTAHGLTAGMPVIFDATALPTNIVANTTYYVIATGLAANTFQVSATLGGAAVAWGTAGTSVFWSARRTVQSLYSEVMNEFDELTQLDDTVPMKYNTPVEYEFINGWDFAADADAGYLYGGSIKVNKTDSIWANFYTLGTIETDGVVYWYQNAVAVATHVGYQFGHIDQLIKVRAAGVDISTDGTAKAVVAFIRNNNPANADLYDNFTGLATATGGRNPVPLATAPDANDTGGGATYSGVTLTFGATTQDIGDGNGAQPYGLIVNANGVTVAQLYERLKYLTRAGNGADVGNGVLGKFYRSINASYTAIKQAPFATYAGGKIFGAQGVWITGVSDASNIAQLIDNNAVVRTPPVTMTVAIGSVAVGDRCFMARSAFQTCTASTSAGLLLTSATHGLSIDTIVYFTSTGTLPTGLTAGVPYYVIADGFAAGAFKVSTTQNGVAVAYTNAGTGTHTWNSPLTTWRKQFTISSTTLTTIVVTPAPTNDIPTGGGVIRVGDNRYPYTSRTGSTFTVSIDPRGEANGSACYVPIIDEQAGGTTVPKTLQYVSDFAVVGRVRKYGGVGASILPFENNGTVTATGLTMSAIRTADTVAT